jgi:ribosomal protein L11 methyltransferase
MMHYEPCLLYVCCCRSNKGPNSVSSDQPAGNAIEIRLTPTQKEHYVRQTGVSLPSSLSLPIAELRRLASVAAKAGSESLPISRSAVRQLLEPEPSGERGGGGPFVVEVALTFGQKEQIGRATGHFFASLRIVPDDVTVTYRETWDDATPLRVGRTIVVKPAGQAHEASDADLVVELPAGEDSGRGVFGTGRHPTTRLALVLLEEHVRPGDRVLDLGTGSGILAVAAARLGAGEVLALDVEAAAVAVARETVSLNGLAGAVEVGRGGIGSAAPPYDVVAANIFPNVLAELAPSLAAAVRSGGVLVASGSVVARAEEAIDAVCAAGLGLEERRSRGNWVGMVFRKP